VAIRQLALTLMMSCTLTGRCFTLLWSFDKKVYAKSVSQSETGKRTSEFQCVRLPHSKIKNLPHSRDTVSGNYCYCVITNHPLRMMISGHWGHHKECNSHVKHKSSTCSNYFVQHLETCKVLCRNFWTKKKYIHLLHVLFVFKGHIPNDCWARYC
jgi:hypothetical protein